MRRAFIIHGWDGAPDNAWIPWLKRELEKRGFKVVVPRMPTPDAPKISTWVAHLAKHVKRVDADTYFVGHSVGCQAIIRYLMTQNKQCGGVIFVAGWFTLKPLSTPDAASKRIARPWFLTPLDLEKTKKNMRASVAIFSDDDPDVPFAKNRSIFKKILGSKIIIEKKKGHFSDDAGITKLPSALKELTLMAG
jgi:hypothetical protein